MEPPRARRALRWKPFGDGEPCPQCLAGPARGNRPRRGALRGRAARAVAEVGFLVQAGPGHRLDADARRDPGGPQHGGIPALARQFAGAHGPAAGGGSPAAARLALERLSANRARAGDRGGHRGVGHGVLRLPRLRALDPAGGGLAAERRTAFRSPIQRPRGPARDLAVRRLLRSARLRAACPGSRGSRREARAQHLCAALRPDSRRRVPAGGSAELEGRARRSGAGFLPACDDVSEYAARPPAAPRTDGARRSCRFCRVCRRGKARIRTGGPLTVRVSLSLRFSLVLCGLLVSAPFLNPHHSYPLLTFYTEWLAFAIGLAALAAIATAPSGAAVPIPGLCVGLFLLTALLVLQAALGQVAYPLRSATGALYAIWASLLAMLGVWLRSELGEAAVSRALQWWIAAAGFLAAASGFVQYYHVPMPGVGVYVAAQPTNWMFGTVGQPNNFADYLGCAVISVAFLHARNALSLLPALLIALPLAAGMALSGSRGPWGYVVIPFAFVPLLRLGGPPRDAKRILRLALLSLAVFVLVQILNLYTGIFVGPEGRPSSSGERLIRYLEIGGTGERPI